MDSNVADLSIARVKAAQLSALLVMALPGIRAELPPGKGDIIGLATELAQDIDYAMRRIA